MGVPIRQQGKWQFLKYGNDCIMMRDRCYIYPCNLCKQGDRFFAWRIPARTVKVFGSTIHFKSGCNLYRAKLLKDIVKAQKSKVLPTYHAKYDGTVAQLPDYCCRKNWRKYHQVPELSIELLVDGKAVASINDDYKRGMIKEALKPYTTKVGRRANKVTA